MSSGRLIETIRWLLASAALAGIVLVYVRWLHVNQTTVALTLLLLILLLAAEWGLRYAVALSFAATACYNFFFLPPIGTFTINDPENWLALFAFLVTSITASRLSERARMQASHARSRQQELQVLFQLSRELLQTESLASLVSSIPSAVASATHAGSGVLYLLDGDRVFRAGLDEGRQNDLPPLRQLALALGPVNTASGEVQIPLRTGVRPRGLLLLRGASISTQTAEAIGGLTSIALDRAQALEGIARGEAMRESERMRTLMIDSVTHELRTPLTSIKGAASALLASGVESEDRQELLTIIDEESDRLNRLVSEAVEMAQLDSQQVRMHFAPVKVRHLVEQARDACAWIAEEHKVTINVPAELAVEADESFLEKVLANLLENAAKYSAAGTPITISADSFGESLAISVADHGIGIDAAEQALIFERFYRARGTGDSSAGTGMGLAISRSIAEAHGGQITVTSQLQQGSVFTLTLPMRQDAAAARVAEFALG